MVALTFEPARCVSLGTNTGEDMVSFLSTLVSAAFSTMEVGFPALTPSRFFMADAQLQPGDYRDNEPQHLWHLIISMLVTW